MNDHNPELPFIEAAQAFCGLVEHYEGHDRIEWLERIGEALLRLESAIVRLQAPSPRAPHVGLADLEKRFELYFRLKSFLRDVDDYWSEADLHAGDGYMTGSLADDFADMYFELKCGLILLQQGKRGTKAAVRFWAEGYRDHWRQHLVDARKQLFDFKARGAS